MRKLSSILILLFSSLLAEATHQVSGYISFKCLRGTTYRVTFTNYTNTCGTSADRDTLRIHWGDGTSTLLVRNNGPYVGGFHNGDNGNPCICRKLNLYDTTHTFPGTGTYHMWIDDPDRMANIANMSNSVGQDFYMFTSVTLGPYGGDSIVSPVITNPMCCINACGGECFFFNPGAYSPTGDSMSYSLGKCLTLGGVANGYYIPPVTTVDPLTGTLKWCSPPVLGAGDTGIYNFVILITSYKNFYSLGHKFTIPVDTVECEFELIVYGNCKNDPPKITGIADTCIVAGTNLTLNYIGSDPDHEPVSLVATGDPFTTIPAATESSGLPSNPITLSFSWNTNCTEVRKTPYQVLVTATDVPAVGIHPLNAYFSTIIHIVGPAPKNLVAAPLGNAVHLHWNPSICPQVTGYSVYRHTGCFKMTREPCVTGVPPSSGYVLIGNTIGLNDTTYIDNNGGRGLVPGNSYDYMVVANYPQIDGSVSYASKDTCVKIVRNTPAIINVSVDSTATNTGTIFVRWTKPVAGLTDFDTNTNPGIYKYVLLRAKGINGLNFAPIDSVTSPYFASAIDTTFKDKALNTYSTGYNYRVDFYCCTNEFKGSSATASSIYLGIKPDNNMLHLSWSSSVPWIDSLYIIYRQPPGGGLFKAIDTVRGTQHSYTDSNLTNGKTLCYYIKSWSAYTDPTIAHPLFDSSELMCSAPKDTLAPCSPKLSIYNKCKTSVDSLVWNNPDYFCPKTNDILLYKIYFTPFAGNEVQLIATINNLKDTTYIYDSLSSIAGCFAVTAVDSFYNESPIDTICVDNCPDYILPNIFTPNGDGKDDFFTPILPYHYVKDVDINIFNRWGQVMFNTINPKIMWNGNDQTTGKPCPDGDYYYVCIVHEIHVTGIKSVTLKGFVQILR